MWCTCTCSATITLFYMPYPTHVKHTYYYYWKGHLLLIYFQVVLSKPLMTLFILILLMFSAKTLIRNWEWGDTERLAVSGLKVNPFNAKVHFAMGNVLAQQVR